MAQSEREISQDLHDFGAVTEERVEQFEALVGEALNNGDTSLITPLILALDDSCEFDEVMFSVVHAVEKFPRDDYFLSLARALPAMRQKSPRWCQIVHTRIINSEAAYLGFLAAFRATGAESRSAEIQVLREISEKEKFRERCLAGIRELDLA